MAAYTALNNNNSNTYLGPEPASPLQASHNAPTGTNANNTEANSLLENADGINFNGPLTPPDPNRFSSFSPSIGTGNGLDSARDSYVSDANSAAPIAGAGAAVGSGGFGGGSRGGSAGGSAPGSFHASKEGFDDVPAAATAAGKSNRKWWIAGGIALLIIAAAVAIPVGVVIGRRDPQNRSAQNGSSSDSDGDSGDSNDEPTTPRVAITGGDGSTVTKEDGSTFTYRNPFGGYWVQDPENPWNNDARPNNWTPPLNSSWRWGEDKIYGVNLGSLFVLEPFITPHLFQKYRDPALANGIDVVDEWTLSQAMAADTSADGGISQLEEHYNTFITEEDIAQIAGAGLNWIRLPIPFWAIDEWDDEPYLSRTCWRYILRVFRWCRKYGLRIKLDVHTAPGSQNGYNHSGKLGQINFLHGVMGYANAQRFLSYVRIITEFISQPEYKDLVVIYGILNEPRGMDIGQDVLGSFYLQVYDTIRNVTGIGEGNGPWIAFSDGFLSPGEWSDFLRGADRIIMDAHPYFAFNGQPNTEPIEDWIARPCRAWGPMFNNSLSSFGMTVGGEFSNAINDCGLFLNGVPGSATYGGDCGYWEDSSLWNQTVVDGLRQFALASFDAIQNFFFWTWKIGNSTSGIVESPLWSYQLGLERGWMPTDPREAIGYCGSLGASGPQFDGTFEPWQTGGTGAGTIAAAERARFTAWPPALNGVAGDLSLLPSYTPTETFITLPPETFSDLPSDVEVGDGWFGDDDDQVGMMTEVAGCTYPDAWEAEDVPMPTTTCGGVATAVRFARRTPAPAL